MFFNGDYFDILLFCIIAALFIWILIKRWNLILASYRKLNNYIRLFLNMLIGWANERKFSTISLDLGIQILTAFFVCHHEPPGNTMGTYALFFYAFFKVFGIYLMLMIFSNLYFALIRTFFSIEAFGKRVLTRASLIMIVILERHEVNSVFTVSIFTLMIFFFYYINMTALFRAVGAARKRTMTTKNIWSSVASILGMFIVLFSALYYVISATFPEAFNRSLSLLDSIYFTLITYSTIGYGDIVAMGSFAKVITIVNALTSVICLVFLVNAIMGFTSGDDGDEKNGTGKDMN